jgi:hypothetical protein
MKTQFDLETERIQKCADELTEIGRRYEFLDFIEALGAVLGTYLMANGGMPALKFYLEHLLRKSEKLKNPDWREEVR